MCKFKDTNLGIKKLDFNVKRCHGRLPDRRPRGHRTRLEVPRHQAPQPQAARGLDDYGRPVFLVRGAQPHLFRQGLTEALIYSPTTTTPE